MFTLTERINVKKGNAKIKGTEVNIAVEACRRDLAMNFQRPAKDTLTLYGSRIGLTGEEMGRLLRELSEA